MADTVGGGAFGVGKEGNGEYGIGGFSSPLFCGILMRLGAYTPDGSITEEERHLWQ